MVQYKGFIIIKEFGQPRSTGEMHISERPDNLVMYRMISPEIRRSHLLEKMDAPKEVKFRFCSFGKPKDGVCAGFWVAEDVDHHELVGILSEMLMRWQTNQAINALGNHGKSFEHLIAQKQDVQGE